MPNIYTTTDDATLGAALEAFDATGGTGLSDTEGEAAVLSILSANGDFASALAIEGVLGTIVTYVWTIVKRVQAKIKSLLDMIRDKIQELLGKGIVFNSGGSGGGGS